MFLKETEKIVVVIHIHNNSLLSNFEEEKKMYI